MPSLCPFTPESGTRRVNDWSFSKTHFRRVVSWRFEMKRVLVISDSKPGARVPGLDPVLSGHVQQQLDLSSTCRTCSAGKPRESVERQ